MKPPLPLPLRLEGPVTVAALMAAMAPARIGPAAAALVARGASPTRLYESAFVAALFCGLPAGVAAMAALAPLEPHRRRVPTTPSRTRLRARGERMFRRIHGPRAGAQLEMLETLHPDFADTVLCEAYGRVLSRPALGLGVRELIGVVVLAILGLERQLRAHLLAAARAGVTALELEQALRLAGRLAGRELAPALAARDGLRAGSPPAPPARSARPSRVSRVRRWDRP